MKSVVVKQAGGPEVLELRNDQFQPPPKIKPLLKFTLFPSTVMKS